MPHFAQLYKCALQVNPYCYSAYRGNSIKDEDEYNASILQKCKQYSIQVVGLANHGDVDSSESLRKLLSENGIVVFPGFEIMSAEKIHKPLERLSKGQQCTAILNILLVENKDPLIVDQPEDNLDNAFIADSLIASIRKNKLLRHYIFATHNANIPVFGDAELIVAMEEQDGKGRIIQGGIGSIDTPSVRDYAVQVLEGGREAFLMREKKYGIGEYNHFMNK